MGEAEVAWVREDAKGRSVWTRIPRVAEIWREQGCTVMKFERTAILMPYRLSAPHQLRTAGRALLDALKEEGEAG